MMILVPDAFYWARSQKHTDGELVVVQVSTIFGKDQDYWTLAVPGSDQHHMIYDFEILERVEPPRQAILREAAE